MLQNWNVDKSKLEKQQKELKESMQFTYVGHGTKATGLFAKEFKRKPGLYARCTTCGYYMPLGRNAASAATSTAPSGNSSMNCPPMRSRSSRA